MVSNLDRRSRRGSCWPLDCHSGPVIAKVNDIDGSNINKVYLGHFAIKINESAADIFDEKFYSTQMTDQTINDYVTAENLN